MPESTNIPSPKRQKVLESHTPEQQEENRREDDESPLRFEHQQSAVSLSPPAISKSHTPRKLILHQSDNRYAFSQPTVSASSLQVPSLQPPETSSSSSRGRRDIKVYSQSPPRSPGRSPTRKLELIQLSPVKNNRIRKLQELYNSQIKKERLFINKLVLNNFKSYAGEQVIGPFNTNFSAVVGPNGSGKSNVIDSMLFVFGFRANKMRQDRLSDLIHKSESFPNLPSCSVDVEFQYVVDKSNGSSKIDDNKPKLIITRKAFKNNSSKYFINGKESSYTEVTKLLKEEGIDLDHKRFLILQGEVENIAQMKPKAEREGDDGLLEYLEDIIGTADYKSSIEKNTIEVDTLNEICIEKENRFEIVEREKNSLESSKNAALEFVKKERRLTLSKSKLLQYNILKEHEKLASTLQKLSVLQEEYQNESTKFENTQRETNKLEDNFKQMNKKIVSIKEDMKNNTSKKRELQNKKASLEEKIKSYTRKKEKASKSIAQSKKLLKNYRNEIETLNVDQQERESNLQSLLSELKKEKNVLEEIKLSLKDKTTDISNEIAQHERELEPWKKQLQEKKLEIQVAESQISLLQENQSKLKDEIEKLKNDLKCQFENKKNQEEKLIDLKVQFSAISTEFDRGESECANAKSKIKDMQHVLQTQRQKVMDARSRLATVENKSKVLSALHKLQKSGRISGFYGRLGDLGVIDNEYDIAISTASARLDDIVVDSVECGQHCIEYLRKNKLGYARFILLEKLRNLILKRIQTPENVKRLFDLVKPDKDIFIPAFYSVLRNTLVAKDLKQANRVAYGATRFRVVTMDGKLIDISGTITGGGKQTAQGLMKLRKKGQENIDIYSNDDIEKIEKELVERENNFKFANDTYFEMEQALQRLKDRKPELELEISKCLMDTDISSKELESTQDQLKQKITFYERHTQNKDEVVEIEHQLNLLQKEYQLLLDSTKNISEKIDKLKKRIMEIGGIDLQMQNSKVNSIIQNIDIIKSKQKRGISSMKKIENEIRRSEKALSGAELDFKTCSKEMDSFSQEMESVERSLGSIDETFLKLENENSELEIECCNLKEKINEAEIEGTKFKSYEIDVKDRLEKLNNLLKHIKRVIKEYDEQLRALELRNTTTIFGDEGDNNSINGVDRTSHGGGVPLQDQNKVVRENNMRNEKNSTEAEMEIDDVADEFSPGIPRISKAKLLQIDVQALEAEIGQLEEYVAITNVNIDVLEEYARRLADYNSRKLDLNQAVERREALKKLLDELKKKRYDEFMQGFGIISMTLKEMYQMITMGGNAELELIDSLDPFSEGVTFSVMPPKKSWRNIANLSGGEKTLSSLALVFALHKYKPTPLYVMDEIDAALDFRNVSIVANYIKERTKNAQFIVISLRNNMFELAQQLIGIYKRDNKTKSAAIRNKDFLKEADIV
ncbi:condensin subunit SMC4 NDAI_0B01970 [Naumovozyma dairenensis CBS 421]|uniref:Structural maintenance of chromosomes protein n=1 Tax=Naumovozyma dairenensis (strain ATCC 10597 / BCRC 20456 / CBS 421 / NBRC 0211 / NRRL Y-12639) TaxID=1071378 RepID=G0W621_NAUDC|nr:hypothetical protein NDAI_0B01970 [Naumovozyma dairenensis CBS 421]CCD23232.1 hypothetical protein NDAI_0B01970 [Naumovozyma dairenensis CBS 421]